MKAVAILGCGPAGLMAAHAAALCGQPVAILSMPEKSRLGGAQFLHEPIPELTDDEPDILIKYRREGSAAIYQAKAYGMGPQPNFVSFDGVTDEMTQPGWNLRKIYDRLWEMYGSQVTPTTIGPDTLPEILSDSVFSTVISSIPLTALCRRDERMAANGHRFTKQTIQIMNDVCHGGPDDNTIWYDGTNFHSWYRASRLFGVASTEWGGRMASMVPYPMDAAVTVHKPLENTCNCWPDLVKVGRFGRWLKGILVQDGFRTTVMHLHKEGLFVFDEKYVQGLRGR